MINIVTLTNTVTTQPWSNSVFMQLCNRCHSPTYSVLLDFFESPQKPFSVNSPRQTPLLLFFWTSDFHFYILPFFIYNVLNIFYTATHISSPQMNCKLLKGRRLIFYYILLSSIFFFLTSLLEYNCFTMVC